MAPEMSLFGPMDIDSYSLYANMRVYGMIILAIVSTIAFFGEKHVCCCLFLLCYPIPTARCLHHAQIDRVSNVCFFIVIFSIICMYAGFFTVATDEKTM